MTELRRDPAEGVLEEADGRWRLRFVRRLPHPPGKVWKALTREEHLSAWFPTTIEGELRPGAALTFRFRGEEAPPVQGEMIACEPPRVLEFTWDDESGDAERSRFELAPDGDGCVLTFVTTYDQVGKSARDAAGWHVCLDLLARHLAGREPPESPHERWAPLNRRYTERFGPEAATIGPPAEFSE